MDSILCISSFEKGQDFLIAVKNAGFKVILVTAKRLENANWPKDSVDEFYFFPDDESFTTDELKKSVSYLARIENIVRIVALDDYDVEKAASLREHLRVPGMGDTTARYFRDKLAMRARANEMGILVPPFVHILNYQKIQNYLDNNEPPFVLKPRMHAGAIGISKIHSNDELWQKINELGDEQSNYLLEKFIPGDIFHVDTIVHKNEIVFSMANEYGLPPMEVAHSGRVFTSSTVKRDSDDYSELIRMNKLVLKSLGLKYGVSHTEFIKSNESGKFYFLETSARVGGANLSVMIEAASGINLWTEWGKLEAFGDSDKYSLPEIHSDYAGIILSLSKQEFPDLSNFDAPEIYWKLNKKFHAGLVVKSDSKEKVMELLTDYRVKFYDEFFASHAYKTKPSD